MKAKIASCKSPAHAYLGHFAKASVLRAGHNTTKWIAGAIKHPGVLKAAAKRAGQSTAAYAQAHKHDSGTTGRRARLAITLRGMHH